MKTDLKLTPPLCSFADIVQAFGQGKPLSGDQLNVLRCNESKLSSTKLDPILHYYLKCFHRKPDKTLSLPIPANDMNKVSLQELKQGILNLLHDNLSHVDLNMTFDQYLKLKALGLSEFIFWQHWEFFTRSPLLSGSLPQLLYFQWGRIFAVVRFDVMSQPNYAQQNVHLYFEEMQNRNLLQCVNAYNQQHPHENGLQLQFAQQYPAQKVIETAHSSYQSPRPSFAPFHKDDQEDH